MHIRQATDADWPSLWPIIKAIVAAGDTYGYDPAMSEAAARNIWMDAPRQTWLVEAGGEVLGTYYIKTNQQGPGAHVCNCGYMVASAARGRGLATAMCEHSQQVAVSLGYRAMQFNFVAASNQGAVALWTRLGFATVGRLPGAFHHPQQGDVDALVMFKSLEAPLPE